MRWVLIIGVVLICAVCFVVVGGLGLLTGNSTTTTGPVINPNPIPAVVTQPPVINQNPAPGGDFTPVIINGQNSDNALLGEIVLTHGIGTGNTPKDTATRFSVNDKVIYAVSQGTNIPAGTHIFARWSRDGAPFEDTNEIVSDRAYDSTYIEFHISATNGTFQPGSYTVQFFINGNPGPQAQFQVS